MPNGLFDILGEVNKLAQDSPTMAPSPWDGIAPTDFDAEGNLLPEPEILGGLNPAPVSLADIWVTQTDVDPVEDAELYGSEGPPVPDDPDPWINEDIPDEFTECAVADELMAREYFDDPLEPPPSKDGELRVIRRGDHIRITDGNYSYWPNREHIMQRTTKKPSELTDAELIALVKEEYA